MRVRSVVQTAAEFADDPDVWVAVLTGAGACGGQFTANTMALALEFLQQVRLQIGTRGDVHDLEDRREREVVVDRGIPLDQIGATGFGVRALVRLAREWK